MKRQVPRWSELRPLVHFGPTDPNRRRARLARAADLWDLRMIARRRTPSVAFDYVDGGANDEITLMRNRQAFLETELVPHILHDVSSIDLSTSIAGGPASLPFGIAPTGFTRMMHAAGERAGVSAAERNGIPFALSTMGTTSIEQVADHAPGARKWFQLYLWKDRDKSLALVERAQAAGFDTLLVTVDTPVPGARLRDRRNGMTIPPRLSVKSILDASYRVEWWFNFLTTEPLAFATLDGYSGALEELITTMFDPALVLDDLRWLRGVWNGRIFVKGVLTVEDALRVTDAGADGMIVSNHGGRQLDRSPVPLCELPAIRSAVGSDLEIILDSGIMSGNDIVVALATGADFTIVGRAYLYGLMAGGEQGVDRAIELLRDEIRLALALVGVSTVAELGPEHARLLSGNNDSGSPSLGSPKSMSRGLPTDNRLPHQLRDLRGRQ